MGHGRWFILKVPLHRNKSNRRADVGRSGAFSQIRSLRGQPKQLGPSCHGLDILRCYALLKNLLLIESCQMDPKLTPEVFSLVPPSTNSANPIIATEFLRYQVKETRSGWCCCHPRFSTCKSRILVWQHHNLTWYLHIPLSWFRCTVFAIILLTYLTFFKMSSPGFVDWNAWWSRWWKDIWGHNLLGTPSSVLWPEGPNWKVLN